MIVKEKGKGAWMEKVCLGDRPSERQRERAIMTRITKAQYFNIKIVLK